MDWTCSSPSPDMVTKLLFVRPLTFKFREQKPKSENKNRIIDSLLILFPLAQCDSFILYSLPKVTKISSSLHSLEFSCRIPVRLKLTTAPSPPQVPRKCHIHPHAHHPARENANYGHPCNPETTKTTSDTHSEGERGNNSPGQTVEEREQLGALGHRHKDHGLAQEHWRGVLQTAKANGPIRVAKLFLELAWELFPGHPGNGTGCAHSH